MISVVIPTRNRSEDLKQVLSSYLEQKHVLEIIIVDDSTKTDHLEKVQKLVQSDPKLIWVKGRRKGGLTAAKNMGVQHSKGDLVFFGEDDLILSKDHLEILLAHQKTSNADIIGGRKIWLTRGETISAALERTSGKKGHPFNHFLIEFRSDMPGVADMPAPFLQTNVLVKKTVFKKIQFDEDYVGFTKGYCWREETDFYMSANENGFHVVFCPHVAAFNLVTDGGGTHHLPSWKSELWVLRNNFYLLKKHKQFIKKKLGNHLPIPVIWGSYFCVRIYSRTRNFLWGLKQKWKYL